MYILLLTFLSTYNLYVLLLFIFVGWENELFSKTLLYIVKSHYTVIELIQLHCGGGAW